MHNLALALYRKKNEISGSDDIIFEPSKTRLQNEGLLPKKLGWFPDKITSDIDAIILGMHARSDNPELVKAQKLGLKIYSYPAFIYEHSKHKTRVVIGGSHGKTTITSMILHVLRYHDIDTDYVLGAQLQGFDNMVRLTSDNDFIVLEGDEYLSSSIDKRPKFHIYRPNIALLSGIAWDHINVFPTFETYKKQFAIFLNHIIDGGSITYNAMDKEVVDLVEATNTPIRKFPYKIPNYQINNGITFIETSEGFIPLEIFGLHNINNLMGAKWICQQMGVDEGDFYDAIASFKGANGRLEKIAYNSHSVAYKDFAHSPSKVASTLKAVREQYTDCNIIACLELHTYSSLHAEFIGQYKETLNLAEVAVVFYAPKTVEAKKMPPISIEKIKNAFQRKDLMVFTELEEFQNYLKVLKIKKTVLLLMSSGNFENLDFNLIKNLF